jgi:apolipoprotein N-acyltransferase
MPTQAMVTPIRLVPAPRDTAAGRVSLAGPLWPALASGGLLWLSFFPVNWGWLGWVALVPLLTLVRSKARPRWVYLGAWAGGLSFYVPALQWMRVADPRMYFTWAGLSVYCSLFFPLALYLIRLLDRRTRMRFVVAVPVVWTALEFFRSFFAGGFPWYLLAHTQHDQSAVIQVADITGAWGVSFLAAAVNALLCQAYLAWRGRPMTSQTGLVTGGVALAAVLTGVLYYGAWRMGQANFRPGPRVALVQGNLPQYLKNNPSNVQTVRAHYDTLSDLAAKATPDLLIWPETSMPEVWQEVWPWGPRPESRAMGQEVARRFRAPVLLGLNSADWGPERAIGARSAEPELVARLHNSALLVDARGDAVTRYDKIHRVPFGEYVPLRDVLPFMNWFAPYDFDYGVTAGTRATRFPAMPRDPERVPVSFGVVICYEDTDPAVTRLNAGADGQPPADFLVNISNDGWFEGTSEHEQHLAVCRFRAVECRRPVARAVNMGVSALIDGNGRVLAPERIGSASVDSGVGPEPATAGVWEAGPESGPLPPGRWGQFKKVAGVLLATVPLDPRTSFYARCGDWLPWTCWALLGVCCFRVARRKGT